MASEQHRVRWAPTPPDPRLQRRRPRAANLAAGARRPASRRPGPPGQHLLRSCLPRVAQRRRHHATAAGTGSPAPRPPPPDRTWPRDSSDLAVRIAAAASVQSSPSVSLPDGVRTVRYGTGYAPMRCWLRLGRFGSIKRLGRGKWAMATWTPN